MLRTRSITNKPGRRTIIWHSLDQQVSHIYSGGPGGVVKLGCSGQGWSKELHGIQRGALPRGDQTKHSAVSCRIGR